MHVPVYHFTYHAFGTWMPDHGHGYTRRGARVLPPDPSIADRYRARMSQPPMRFTPGIQRIMIEELQAACEAQGYTLHSVATDATHLHVVVSWDSDRSWQRVRAGLQSSLSRRLNALHGKRKWFVANPSRKRVKDPAHLTYLVEKYHPGHRGWKWERTRGRYR
jgi:hypothetical protein